ncbi:conserved hypothetical protein [Theileria orientalis strain Shintoku]|uniref:Uncharacterized protein n=1 Tax=Theileria orientalis strain Shintoku TaxID=869250 RepID=J4CCH5_THEOR|nr:conserved hypothetical protein [Theileria orientalis strain Shintoku]BAM39402.1 conserved hypothetical protein [Theileria orientalis strain Shintoku]|eukprot:XP_009689703.1 conserved hypothetical protein [Theileria orientalis strain Shintoku]
MAVSEELEEVIGVLEGKFEKPDIRSTIENLMDEYEFSDKAVVGAYKRCKDEKVEDANLMSCFIGGLYREKILENHKIMLCASEYFSGTYMDCFLTCFENYTPECLTCAGEHLPNLIDCMLGLPYEFQ